MGDSQWMSVSTPSPWAFKKNQEKLKIFKKQRKKTRASLATRRKQKFRFFSVPLVCLLYLWFHFHIDVVSAAAQTVGVVFLGFCCCFLIVYSFLPPPPAVASRRIRTRSIASSSRPLITKSLLGPANVIDGVETTLWTVKSRCRNAVMLPAFRASNQWLSPWHWMVWSVGVISMRPAEASDGPTVWEEGGGEPAYDSSRRKTHEPTLRRIKKGHTWLPKAIGFGSRTNFFGGHTARSKSGRPGSSHWLRVAGPNIYDFQTLDALDPFSLSLSLSFSVVFFSAIYFNTLLFLIRPRTMLLASVRVIYEYCALTWLLSSSSSSSSSSSPSKFFWIWRPVGPVSRSGATAMIRRWERPEKKQKKRK